MNPLSMKQEKLPEQALAGRATEADSPRFGRLLLVLLFAVALIIVITVATEAYYTP